MSQDDRSPTESALISASTILILSGFLIGITVGKFAAAELSPYVLAGGLSGFLAFLALDHTASRRNQHAQKVEQQEIEQRLDRHMHSLTSVGFTLDTAENSSTCELEQAVAELQAQEQTEMETNPQPESQSTVSV